MKIPESGYELHDLPEVSHAQPSPTRVVADQAAALSLRFPWRLWLIWLSVVGLCLSHLLLIWIAMGHWAGRPMPQSFWGQSTWVVNRFWEGMTGGWEGMTSDWPLLQADHGIHYRHGLLSREFLRTTGMSAGYDPGFMSGYPMSIVSDLSSTFSNLVMTASGNRPALGYKLHVFGCSSLFPILLAVACVCWQVRPAGILTTVLLSILYFWTDFPVKYAGLGMLNYLLSVPLAMISLAGLTSYFERGGLSRWCWACGSASLVFLVHLTSPLLLAPAGLLAYAVAVGLAHRSGQGFPRSRHLGLWSMAPIILVVNLFWLWPGFLLRDTKGASDISFAHPEPVLRRISEIFWKEQTILPVLIGFASLGLVVLIRKRPVVAAGLGGLLAAGFGWGYLAGAFRVLDSLQPGRHTYAFYTAACVLSGIGLAEVFERLRPARIGGWLATALIVSGVSIFGPWMWQSLQIRVFSRQPFLSSKPTVRIDWVLEQIRKHVRPGDRLLFEETGLGIPGLGDPYEIRHCSAVIPGMTGVELIGGPYLHSTVTTNFTQFGENKLFGKANWTLDHFLKYARIYRPAAICCWSPRARSFCRANPDLVQILEDDGIVMVGRIKGFEGSTIQGKATVKAGPNRIEVSDAVAEPAAGGDGLVVLRYHLVPYLKATPPTILEPVYFPDDPVPFIGIKPTAGPISIEMVFPPRK